jgi:hypothetical protein
LPIKVDAIAASLLRAPPATEVSTPVEHIATRRLKEVAKSSRAGACWNAAKRLLAEAVMLTSDFGVRRAKAEWSLFELT